MKQLSPSATYKSCVNVCGCFCSISYTKLPFPVYKSAQKVALTEIQLLAYLRLLLLSLLKPMQSESGV